MGQSCQNRQARSGVLGYFGLFAAVDRGHGSTHRVVPDSPFPSVSKEQIFVDHFRTPPCGLLEL
jgi:hypothetical protein